MSIELNNRKQTRKGLLLGESLVNFESWDLNQASPFPYRLAFSFPMVLLYKVNMILFSDSFKLILVKEETGHS